MVDQRAERNAKMEQSIDRIFNPLIKKQARRDSAKKLVKKELSALQKLRLINGDEDTKLAVDERIRAKDAEIKAEQETNLAANLTGPLSPGPRE